MPSSIRVVRAGGGAFVVDGERAAAVGDGAVVHHRDARRGDALAHEAGEGAGFLAVEVAFEAVADGLVEQDAWPAVAEDDLHFACRGGDGIELEEGLAQGFVCCVLPDFFVEHAAVAFAAAEAVGAGFALAVALYDDADVEADEGAEVGSAVAVRADDLHGLPFAVDGGHDLDDAGILAAGVGIDALQDGGAAGEARRRRAGSHRSRGGSWWRAEPPTRCRCGRRGRRSPWRRRA